MEPMHDRRLLRTLSPGFKTLPRDDRANAAKERARYILKNLANLAPRDAPAKLRRR